MAYSCLDALSAAEKCFSFKTLKENGFTSQLTESGGVVSQMIPDPTDPSVYFIGQSTEAFFGLQVGPAVLVNVHPQSECAGEHCVVHNPSDHHMRTWPLNWREDRGLMERVCPHKIGHPDPDSLAFLKRSGREHVGTHGCDGCCQKQEVEDSKGPGAELD